MTVRLHGAVALNSAARSCSSSIALNCGNSAVNFTVLCGLVCQFNRAELWHLSRLRGVVAIQLHRVVAIRPHGVSVAFRLYGAVSENVGKVLASFLLLGTTE